MGTRSRIAVMHGEVCKSIYCHWDGYLEHNGAILQEHYDSAKANQLVALGDLSSLRPEIGVKHPFSCLDAEAGSDYEERYGDMCTFYDRDRGETECTWSVDHTFELFFLEAVARFYNLKPALRGFVFFQPLHIFYTIIAGLFGQVKTYTWKGRKVK